MRQAWFRLTNLTVAAVNWITWNTDQWVSYDDGQTFELKQNYANRRYLGDTMIWALDQDDSSGISASNLLGLSGTGSRFASKIALKDYSEL